MLKTKEKSKGELTQDLLLEFILASGLRPGDRLPTEDALAVKFGVSRVSAREALLGLKFLGLLTAAPRRGTTLAEIDFARLSRFLGFHLAYAAAPGGELVEARLAIELGALELLCGKLSDGSLRHLRQAAENCALADDIPAENELLRQRDATFHRALLEACGNAALNAFSSVLEAFFQRLRAPATAEASRRIAADHLQIVEALHDNNIDLARGLMRRHLATHRRAGSQP